jgi:predicted dehydrogenase
MNQPALKVGIIGVANFGAYRRQTLRQSGRFQVVAVCDRNEQSLAAAAKEENAKAYADFDAMLKHPGLEALVVSTGADTHARFSVAAMRAGLHVFVEKPLCTSVAEVQELRRAQRETARVVGVGHSHCPSDSLLKLARGLIEQGKLGVVTAYEENSSHSGGLEIKPGDWRGLAERNPGGMLFQCGVHALHGLSWLFGPVAAVQAMMRYDANPNTQTADAANVLLRHPTGLIGTLNCYHTTAYCHELRIFGTKGNLYFDTNDKKGWFQPRRRGEVEEREPLTIPAPPPGFVHANVDSWFDAIRGGDVCYPSLEDGIQAVLPVFAAESAAKQRREVSLRELETV